MENQSAKGGLPLRCHWSWFYPWLAGGRPIGSRSLEVLRAGGRDEAPQTRHAHPRMMCRSLPFLHLDLT